MAKKSKKAFVDAVRARGGIRYFDLGGGVDLAKGAQTVAPSSVGNNTTVGGITGFLTPQTDYTAQLAPTTQLNYTPVINAAANNALSLNPEFQKNLAAEQQVLQGYQDQAAGVAPSPARAALASATGQNVANTAAAMAGTRGSSTNAGAIARQAGQAGAAIQQNAAGQGATLAAQEALAGRQGAASTVNQIGQQILAKQAGDTSLFGTGTGAANAQNAGLVANYGQAQGANASIAAANASANQKTGGGLLGGLGSLVSSLFAEGGEVEDPTSITPTTAGDSARSFVGKFLSGVSSEDKGLSNLGSAIGKGVKSLFANPLSPTPSPSLGGASAGATDLALPMGGAMLASKGTEVPGKAKVGGDSLKNDTVPAMLSPGEIVLPRSVTQAPDAPKRAAAFVQAILAKQGPKRGKKNG